MKRCFLAALWCLIIRRSNLEVVTKRLLHQQVKILGQFKCHVVLGSMSQKLFSVVWIFPSPLGVNCFDRQVLN